MSWPHPLSLSADIISGWSLGVDVVVVQSAVTAAGGGGEPAEELFAVRRVSGRGEGEGDDLLAAEGRVHEDGTKYQNGPWNKFWYFPIILVPPNLKFI